MSVFFVDLETRGEKMDMILIIVAYRNDVPICREVHPQ